MDLAKAKASVQELVGMIERGKPSAGNAAVVCVET